MVKIKDFTKSEGTLTNFKKRFCIDLKSVVPVVYIIYWNSLTYLYCYYKNVQLTYQKFLN